MSTYTRAISSIRNTVKENRAARHHRLRLERELAAYSSPDERRELDAILGRHTAEEARDVEAILLKQAEDKVVRHHHAAR
jgi:hypothetical protein